MRGNYNIDEEPLPAGWRLALTDCFWSGKPVISSLHRVQHVIIRETCDQQTKLHLIRQSCIKYMEVEKAFGTSLLTWCDLFTKLHSTCEFIQKIWSIHLIFRTFNFYTITGWISSWDSLVTRNKLFNWQHRLHTIDCVIVAQCHSHKEMFSWINQSFAKKQVFSISRFWPQKMHRRKMYFTSLIFTIGFTIKINSFNLLI